MSKNKNGERKGGAPEAAVNRRSFIKGMGITAAIGMGGIPASEARKAYARASVVDTGSGPLRRDPLVMIWRRVSSLHKTKDFVGNTLDVPYVGHDPTSIMYDAGGALVGFTIEEVSASGDPPPELCSELNLQPFSLQNNPASSLVYAPSNFIASLEKLRRERGLISAPLKTDVGEKLSFLDEDGNFSILYRPSSGALTGSAGHKLETILREHRTQDTVEASFGQGRKTLPKPSDPLIGIEFLVSDLAKSREFYKERLGLRMLESGKNEAKFDVGSLILTLRTEPTSGLVQFLAKSGRLLGDWFVFHVKDIKATSKALIENGIKFPVGIETSVIGQVAYFNDPDQYSLVLWQSSGMTKMIDFNPALDRILKLSKEPRA